MPELDCLYHFQKVLEKLSTEAEYYSGKEDSLSIRMVEELGNIKEDLVSILNIIIARELMVEDSREGKLLQ